MPNEIYRLSNAYQKKQWSGFSLPPGILFTWICNNELCQLLFKQSSSTELVFHLVDQKSLVLSTQTSQSLSTLGVL